MAEITINGKIYDHESLSVKIKNYLLAFKETQDKKIITLIEIERCDVLLKYYDEKIKEELKNYNK
jgi:hypothetical protein